MASIAVLDPALASTSARSTRCCGVCGSSAATRVENSWERIDTS
ncbi:hypothetical protein [Microbacterium hominis]|nr:hypothetical protein [Microbacterium hominis]